MRQREYNAVDASPSTTSTRPHERLDHAAPGAGNATGKEWAQELRSSMAESPASTTSDTTGGPGPVSGGQRSPGFQEAEDARGEEEEGEDVDWELDGEELVTRVPMRRSSRLRASIRPRSPFRRHSWEPGKKFLREVDGDHERSVSLEGLEDADIEEAVQAVGWPARQGHDPRRTPITHSTGELESLLSLTEEESEEEDLLGISVAGMSRNMGGSLSGMNEALDDGSRSGLRIQEEVTTLSHRPEGHRKGEFTEQSNLDPRPSTKAHRTVSFLKKMAGLTKQNREKEKLKEREKEAKERETRITNGHLFNSITVSGNTLCYACNKSIIAKEAFICPNCNVTIHKSCKDTLSSCTKVKQKQLKAAQAKNNSALHNVSMRHKAPLGRERPSSAIYPSDSFRQSPLFSQLGSRRCRTPFQSLSKSVSTNNIGNLNDDTPLGIRRILSQSTDSLNMRNRTLSIESLIDEGAEVIYQQLMGDLETDEKHFEADSWSLAVETSFLQQHRKDVMKRQDVIYELIQTEVHHMRTLKIMSDIFRKGMLEELQMDRNTADTMFPALDDLIEFHIQFLSRLLDRRKESLLSDSDKNFVINRLGDILVSQVTGMSSGDCPAPPPTIPSL
ncbi:rho guanine nucleotide exchange factor 2-like isoform X2 [Heterodontus francisci]|uniref:rho guanine nucleotide exchange factor 2-like isoform X2 n=1 Tax=Heterodontus francisci TaxID=7792 RepID=UPI00355AD79E